jgi:hypothetical protein
MDTEIKVYCYNTVAAIAIAHNLVQHDRTKHVKVNMLFIKQKLNKKIVMLRFIKFKDHLTNIITKAISSTMFHCSLNKLSIQDIFAST